MKFKLNGDIIFVTLLLLGLVYAIFFWPKTAGAFPVGGVIIVQENDYQRCVDTCLAYNGYDTNTYLYCQNQCTLYPNPSFVIIGGGWFHRHDYDKRHEPRHEEPRHEPRHDEPRHDHDRR